MEGYQIAFAVDTQVNVVLTQPGRYWLLQDSEGHMQQVYAHPV